MLVAKINWSKILGKIGLHLLFWVFIVTYFAWGFGFDVHPKQSILNALFYLPGHLIMVYTLLYLLVPRYLLHRRFLPFLVGFILTVSLCSFYTVMAQLSVNNDPSIGGAKVMVGRNILPFIHVGAIASSIKLLKHWYFQKRLTVQAEQQRTVAELKLLKAQLHPHFLFNTLNNLYSHTLEVSPKSPEIVMKLSGLLRFMIYESNTPKIELTKEIELLKNYISLEQLRYGDRLDISISISGDVDKYQIAPLLMLPFLENAFKHGTSNQIDQCWISLNLAMEGNVMHFKLVNSMDFLTDNPQGKIGGLGLHNVLKRLQLLYKNRYTFETIKLEDTFVVNLDLELEKLKEQCRDKLVLNTKDNAHDL